MKKRLTTIFLLLAIAGCCSLPSTTSDPVSPEVYKRWHEDLSYYALIEIVEAHLTRPDWDRPTKQDVLKYLGKPNWGTINQDPEKEWGYVSKRHVPYQNHAMFIFNDKDELIEIDWLSE